MIEVVKVKKYIYKITNQINNKCYIGQTKDYKQRFADHRRKLRKNKHENQHLQCAWNKYKEEKSKIDSDDRKNASITELTNLVKNINIDNVQKYINNAQKAINVISELTAKKPVDTISTVAKTPRVINKFFGD